MHDIADLESRGVPGVMIASSEFADAVVAQGRALGFHPAAVLVAHPIQDRTDVEMRALAESCVEDVVRALVSG